MGQGFLYQEKEHTVKVLRCYGEDGRIEIPALIGGKPVTELGDYIFSDKMRETPDGQFWEERTDLPDVSAVTEQETEQRPGGSSREESAGEREPKPDVQSKMARPLCGDLVREVALPPSLERIGRYAFYCCDKLRTLKLTCSIRDIGAGAFNSCRKITCLEADVVKGEKSCLKEILSDLNEELTVEYRELENSSDENKEAAGRARLLFPVFYEEAVENTPARILETHVHGCGHRYRYCFQATEFKFREYDALLPHAIACEDPVKVASLAVGRLRFPLGLSGAHRFAYESYLMEHMDAVARYLAEKGDQRELGWFLSYFSPEKGENFCTKSGEWIKVEHASASCLGNEGLAARAHEEYNDIRKPVLGETGFDKLIEIFSRLDRAGDVSLLMDKRYRAHPPKKRRLEW